MASHESPIEKFIDFSAEPTWPLVLEIISTLNKNHHTAYLAGGCVRDALLGRPVKDFDIATSATPQEVTALFQDHILVGEQFGVVAVKKEKHTFEVATFRKDGAYQDGRHPDSVEYSGAQEDARRRDFTINALFYDPVQRQLFDYADGLKHLKQRLICTVGQARERFAEDKLRLLRAVRFAAQLGFALEEHTKRALFEMSEELVQVACERQVEELNKIFISPYLVEGFTLLWQSGLIKNFIPEDDSFYCKLRFDQYEDLFSVVKKLRDELGFSGENDLLDIFWCVFYLPFYLNLIRNNIPADRAREKIKNKMQGLHHSRHRISSVGEQLLTLQSFAQNDYDLTCLEQLGSPRLEKMFSKNGKIAHYLGSLDFAMKSANTKFLARKKIFEHFKYQLPLPLFTGQDLLNRGVPAGPRLGRLLGELYTAQLSGKINKFSDLDKFLANSEK